jgi:adenine phosphoribosyltransferase|tara:strand:+ start:1087 stop:1638 length:552 start_codon:yes stop_codon:yes gene_type:complete
MTIIKPTPKTIQNLIRVIPDHPRPGVLYQDMASIFNAPKGLQNVMSLLNDYITDNKIEFNKIVGLDARGFPMAGALSASTGIPFSMARKKGKLPGETIFTEYELEYGTDELHLQKGAIEKGDKVLILDDVIATGGTLEAVITLTDRFQADVVGILSIMELEFLGGGAKLRDSGYNVYSILQEQ